MNNIVLFCVSLFLFTFGVINVVFGVLGIASNFNVNKIEILQIHTLILSLGTLSTGGGLYGIIRTAVEDSLP